MDITFVKFLIIGTICEIIGLTTSMSLKHTIYDPNTRLKRSPADNFSLFGFGIRPPFSVPNPLTKAKESFGSFEGIFAPATFLFQDGNIDRNYKPIEPQSYKNNNVPIDTVSPIEYSNQSGIQSTKNEHATLKKVDKKTIQQEDKNKFDIKLAPEKYQLFNNKSHTKTKIAVSERNDDDSENKKVAEQLMENIFNEASNDSTNEKLPSENLENEIDKKLLDYIFHITPDYNIEGTIADSTIDYTTETGDYESTTTDELLRIPPNVVASLLG